MHYVSTRGQAPDLNFPEVVVTGLASDGGLYVPASWPSVSADTLRYWRSLGYADLATEIMALFAGDSVSHDDLHRMAHAAYGSFSHEAKAPLLQLEENLWVLELFHGPTLAFKDFAMQFLGQLFDHVLRQSGEQRTIVGATSGDTGSAAIEAFRGLSSIELFMLFPHGRVSDVQRRQMTTVLDENIHTLAITGDFDDCQRLVKAMFADARFRDEQQLSVVNSINWARVAAQVVYYVWAALKLGAPEREVSFSVPSGNFGNVFAGYVAKKMGLPIKQLIVGSNRNDSLTRFFAGGSMTVDSVTPSVAPSMDVQVSSNFERLLFELVEREGSQVKQLMDNYAQQGSFQVSPQQHQQACELFRSASISDEETVAEMRRVLDASGYVIDPHSAIGTAAARDYAAQAEEPVVVMATAHPAKFPDVVRQATGDDAPLPERMQRIMTAEEKYERAEAELGELQAIVRRYERQG